MNRPGPVKAPRARSDVPFWTAIFILGGLYVFLIVAMLSINASMKRCTTSRFWFR